MKILVPLSADLAPDRAAIWGHLRGRWRALLGQDAVVEGIAAGPWRKGAAVRAALETVSDDVVAIVDADVWIGDLAAAERAVLDGAPWVQPFDRLVRLNEPATTRALAGEDPLSLAEDRLCWAESPYEQSTAGGLVVLRRDTALAVPIDPRFVGWGGEDIAWRDALDTLVGRRVRFPGVLAHLWHKPQERRSRASGSRDNQRLRRVYMAARHRPEAMRRLVGDATAAL